MLFDVRLFENFSIEPGGCSIERGACSIERGRGSIERAWCSQVGGAGLIMVRNIRMISDQASQTCIVSFVAQGFWRSNWVGTLLDWSCWAPFGYPLGWVSDWAVVPLGFVRLHWMDAPLGSSCWALCWFPLVWVSHWATISLFFVRVHWADLVVCQQNIP